MEVVASLSQGRTAAAQCGLFTYKSVPVIFDHLVDDVSEYSGLRWFYVVSAGNFTCRQGVTCQKTSNFCSANTATSNLASYA